MKENIIGYHSSSSTLRIQRALNGVELRFKPATVFAPNFGFECVHDQRDRPSTPAASINNPAK
jgi:hypothetical protein